MENSVMSETFQELFEASLKGIEMRIGKVISGTVVAIDKEYAWVDAGLKSEAIIPLDEFKDREGNLDINEGDQVEAVLETLDNGNGQIRLSREKARRIEIWRKLEQACENQETVQGMITGHVRGGYTIDVSGLKAFLPGSLIDVRPLRDVSHLENKELDLKIIKLDPKRNNIVVSRRAVIEAETQVEREAMLEKLTEGAKVSGIVKNITDFGAFIDLGGIDGLLHITDMSWSRIKHPSHLLSIGDEVTVKVIKFDREKGRISLGLKQLGEDPWKNVEQELPVGTKVKGKVTNITDYGCFVKIKEGIEGLVHTSEMDWSNKTTNPHKLVSLDQEVDVVVLEMDTERHRISLGMKQCTVNPWQDFADKNKPGTKVRGSIRSVTDFGIFIGLEGGIDGLIHISDISWTKSGEEAIKEYRKGMEVEAVVLSVDVERERIALGIKQVSEDPFMQYIEVHDKGAVVKGTVALVQQNGAEVTLSEGVKGFIKVADISSHHVDHAGDVLKEGQEVEAKITNIDKKRRSISLSMRALNEMSDDRDEAPAPTTIGDLIREKMNNNK